MEGETFVAGTSLSLVGVFCRHMQAPPPLISVNDILKAHRWNGRQLKSLLVVLGVGLSEDAQKNRRLRTKACKRAPGLSQLDRPSLGIVASFLSERCRVNYRKAGASSSFGEDGIMYGLGTAFGSAPWVNPEQNGMARITRSTRGSGAPCVGHASAFAGQCFLFLRPSSSPSPSLLPHPSLPLSLPSVRLLCHRMKLPSAVPYPPPPHFLQVVQWCTHTRAIQTARTTPGTPWSSPVTACVPLTMP
jgi:hypothetical protein